MFTLPVDLKSGHKFLIELDDVDVGNFEFTGPFEDSAEVVTEKHFESLLGIVSAIGETYSSRIIDMRQQMGCEKVSASFSFSLTGEVGVWLLKAKSKGCVDVTLHWS